MRKKWNNKESMICLMLKPSPDLNPLDYATWGVLEKIPATSHPNIDSLKAAIEVKLNKMSEEFILKTCKSFRRCVYKIFETKWWSYWVNLLFFVYLLILFFFFFKLKLVLFYNRNVNYFTRKFLILFPHTVNVDEDHTKKTKIFEKSRSVNYQ